MAEYRIKGLSCANCARELEEEIQKLPHGEDAKILYHSGKLQISNQIDISKVEKILASDGASIIQNDEEKEHVHQDSNSNWKLLLFISTVLYVLALLAENKSPSYMPVLFYLAASAVSGHETFIKGMKNLFHFKFNMNTLMTIALIGAFCIGQWKEAAFVAILFGLNEYLEGLGMEKARRSMESLLRAAPKEAVLLVNGEERVIPIDQLKIGDIVLVKSGEKIPSDGVVIEGKSSVNEAAVTGESLPIEKSTNDPVFGGSINNEGVLKVKMTKLYNDSSIAKILRLVEEAQSKKTPIETFMDRFAQYYTPLILIISFFVILIPPLFLNWEWNFSLYQGLAVLIVGCPCALLLASPIALISGITRNARNGILMKGGVFLEQLGKIKTIALDKTGTLTAGKPVVEKTIVYDDQFYFIAASVESSSGHPLAKAVFEAARKQTTQKAQPEQVITLPGKGVKAVITGKSYFVGNEKSAGHLQLSETIQKDLADLKKYGYTIVMVSDESKVFGMMGVTDQIRPESHMLVSKLHQAGIKQVVMLTGDHKGTAEKVAKQTGIQDVYAGLLPDEKLAVIQELSKHEKTAMIGDGINDAPALAAADLGIAMGKGSDSAIETADVVLMQDHLGKLPSAIAISKRVNRTIQLNIGLALGLKLVALLLTIPGWLTLWIAIMSDMGATIIITLISLSILMETKKEKQLEIS
ncbi:cation-translocating P-type ATPase [Bacillus smithii]|uniref:heavy metal translocating P-type ATPase n=1 Tax=Bacillus smithii TaxID=1479 RepID=UPI0030C9C82A